MSKPLPKLPITTNKISHDLLGSVSFRNWTLGEHQDTLFKREDNKDSSEVLISILENCITSAKDPKGRDYTISQLPLPLAELVFIKIREISVGDTQDYIISCKSDKCIEDRKSGVANTENKLTQVRVTANLSESALVVPEEFKHDIVIGNYTIRVKLPRLEFLDFTAKQLDGENIGFIASNIEYIANMEGELWNFGDYTQKEREDFVRTLPPSFIIVFINNFKYIPRVETPIHGTCSNCGTEQTKQILGISSLFMD